MSFDRSCCNVLNFLSKRCGCLISVTPVYHDIGIRDCEAEVCVKTILSPQLFHLDAINWEFLRFLVSICTIRIEILSFIALNGIQH